MLELKELAVMEATKTEAEVVLAAVEVALVLVQVVLEVEEVWEVELEVFGQQSC